VPAVSAGRASPPERGSVLMLMPAAVLIVIVLASIAVDFTIAFLGEREAASLAAGAANDAATAAVDEQAFRRTGEFRIDENRARRVAHATLAASSSELDAVVLDVEVTSVGGEPAVTVTVRGTVDYVFAPAIPGAPHGTEVEASATAVARVG
jgi:Flp pilus assembly protein TadG